MTSMLASGEVAVTPVARALARDLLYRPLPAPLVRVAAPIVALARLPAVGFLPPAVREQYGLRWSPRRERALALLAATSRHALPLMPAPLRHWPAARRAVAR
jgi:uncharacterized protein (DUF2236 family)